MPRPLRFPSWVILALSAGLTLPAAFAQPTEVYPLRSGPAAQTLNGQWQFKYLAGTDAGADAAFSAPDFVPAAGWKPIVVPGHWELQGFAEPKYGMDLIAGTGLYRRTFQVPAAWTGQRVFLHFDGVLYGFDAWVNGRKIGSWASAYNPVAFDITDALKSGAYNVLAVQVSTRSHGWEFDVNDCWGLSGIYRDVTLFAVPVAHFTDCTARTKLNPDGSATLTISTLTSAPTGISGRLLAPDGRLVSALAFATGKLTGAEATLQLEHPQLWTAETPALYTLELALASGQQLAEKIGLREVTIADGVLKLNGKPIKLRGVDHHDIWPVNGRVATEELMRHDLELMRAANINFIRTSHYPPHPRLLELCDELGFYVMDEVPFGFGENHLTDPAYQDDLYVRARATVRRDRDRASVIVWSVGNENPNTPLTIATARRVKELDPTRPVCFPQEGGYFAPHYTELPPDIDIYAPHYPSTTRVSEYAATLTRPIIFTEYAHALGLASDQIQAQWAIMQASPRIAGGSIWMFQDQGILRTATAGQTPASTHNLGLAVWPDEKHYYDSAGNQGMDGIVYSDRTPQVDYWQVRKVYSPVQIAEISAPGRPGANRLTLHVENRFDFHALTGVTLAWALQKNGTGVEQGSSPLHAAAHATEEIPVAFTLPAEPGADVYTLVLQCSESSGKSFYERTVKLATLPAGATRAAELAAGWPPAPLTLSESAAEFRVTHARFELVVQRATGALALHDPTGRVLAAGLWPHVGRRFTEGELMRSKRELTWTGDVLREATGVTTTATRTADGILLQIHGRYIRADARDQALEGDLRLLVRAGGSIDIDYDYTPVNGKGLLLEAGVALLVPPDAAEFRWQGAGPYAGYPGKDALNEFGAYHLNRADLNFQGNRRAVELALLTDATGAGLALGGEGMDVAVERVDAGTIFAHNAVLSGRGTKFARPDTAIQAETTTHVAGKFTVIPVNGPWPAQLAAWFGPAAVPAKIFQPYLHSYDQ